MVKSEDDFVCSKCGRTPDVNRRFRLVEDDTPICFDCLHTSRAAGSSPTGPRKKESKMAKIPTQEVRLLLPTSLLESVKRRLNLAIAMDGGLGHNPMYQLGFLVLVAAEGAKKGKGKRKKKKG